MPKGDKSKEKTGTSHADGDSILVGRIKDMIRDGRKLARLEKLVELALDKLGSGSTVRLRHAIAKRNECLATVRGHASVALGVRYGPPIEDKPR